ncbi:MAG: hypothetical protein KBC35_04325 [Candidatus Pacebacteria bacterium]|nr:hypothetical protein [Candidatus Paceibacterota bacterium]
MNQKWNLQDIRPAEPRKRRVMSPTTPVTRALRPEMSEEREVEPELHLEGEREHIPSITIEDATKKGNKRVVISVITFVVIVGGALLLSALLGKTEITIYPQHREPNINSEFTAYPDKRDDSLSYEVMTIESTSESQVKASGQVEVKKEATGIIEIIKTTPGTERIIANTRFRSPDGKIFRINEAVVVPGAVDSVPGTIQAEVIAAETGESYNLPANTRFDIPGFQEGGLDDLYKSIYAENRSAFTGGFDGPQFQIDENELGTARQALQVKLRDELLKRVEAEKPAGFITFPGAVTLTYNQLPAVEYGDDLVTIREQAILQVPLFNAEEFGTYLAKEAVATYSGGPVRVEDTTALTFEYKTATTSSTIIANEPSLTFILKGKPLLIWGYDAKKLTTDLAGLPKTAINNAVSAYPGIDGAKVNITPFWKRSFPDNAEEIIVIEELREQSE